MAITTTWTGRTNFKINYLIQEALGKILTESGKGILLESSTPLTTWTKGRN